MSVSSIDHMFYTVIVTPSVYTLYNTRICICICITYYVLCIMYYVLCIYIYIYTHIHVP